MKPPPIDESRAGLIWALWHNIDPEVLAAAAEETADTISVQSYEVSYKHTPSNAFPNRKTHYAEIVKKKAKQNAARIQYSSTAPPMARAGGEDEIWLQAKSTTFCETPRVKMHTSDTFLTDLPEYFTVEPASTETTSKTCMPAFLPTIQAKTRTKTFVKSKSSEVRRYLKRNDLASSTTASKPFTADSFNSHSTLSCVAALKKSVLPREIHAATTQTQQKPKKRKTAKYKTKYKHTGSRKKKMAKLYIGKDREHHTPTANSLETSSSSKSFHSFRSFVTPRDDLVNHFSRISMRQVQATLNNNKLSLPSLC